MLRKKSLGVLHSVTWTTLVMAIATAGFVALSPSTASATSDVLSAAQIRALTLAKAPNATVEVRRCLAARTAALSTCLVAASRLQMPSAAPLVRQIIRDGKDPTAMALAGRVLGGWYDRHSADLLFTAMAEARGGADATPHLLEGWLSLHPKHEARYLRWLWAHALLPEVKLEFAIRLITRTHGNEALAKTVRAQLLAAWERWRGDSEIDREAPTSVNARALRVAWALFADPAGCRTMFRRLGLSQGRGLRDPLLKRLQRSRCRPFLPRHGMAVDTRKPIPSLPEWTRRFPSEDWGSVGAWLSLRRPAQYKIKGLRQLERFYRGLPVPVPAEPPLGLKQPGWWPPSIVLTIDDGPRPAVLHPLLDTLERAGVKAVFFFVGSQLTRSLFEAPEATTKVLRRVSGGGHAIGFHSMNHAIRLHRHLLWRERDQVADAVRAFRVLVVGTLEGACRANNSKSVVAMRWARLPGGQGRLKSWVNAGLQDAGVSTHIHWELGGHQWGQRTGKKAIVALARQACIRHRRGQKTRVLLHEAHRSARQVATFIEGVRRHCSQNTP